MSDYLEAVMDLLFIFLFIGMEVIYLEDDKENDGACLILTKVFSSAWGAVGADWSTLSFPLEGGSLSLGSNAFWLVFFLCNSTWGKTSHILFQYFLLSILWCQQLLVSYWS